jgi:3-oxoacyl-[acyl-carrier-protein] synthase-3
LIYSRIAGTGSFLPERIITNAEMEKLVETSDDWIASRTGIRQRHIAVEGQTTGDLAFGAAKAALEAAGVAAKDIDLIVVGTTTPDLIFPSTACLLQDRLGANGCPAFDVNAACSGFIYALTVADKFIRSGSVKTALVVGAETLSRMLDWSDRSTVVAVRRRRRCGRAEGFRGSRNPVDPHSCRRRLQGTPVESGRRLGRLHSRAQSRRSRGHAGQ